MKIKKKGNFFVAHRDESDTNAPDGVGMNSRIKVGDSLGKISIKTGKFSGNTVCMTALNKHLEDFIENDFNTPKEGVTYKLWITIERIDENKGKYEDLKHEETRSIGEFDTVDDARDKMNLLGDLHQGKHTFSPSEINQEFIDKCIDRIADDVKSGDFTAIDELLKFVPTKYLQGYLAED